MVTQIARLTTIGRTSGQPRSVLINAFPAGDSYMVVGSNAGADSHSQWYLNLKADPSVTVEVSGEQFTTTARDTEGEERDRLWAKVIEADPNYEAYERRTDREIPVIVLEREP